MSGFTVALRVDGGPIGRGLIECLTVPLAVRGPDAQRSWCDESAALGYAHMQVGAQLDVQPLTIDSERWIVADARIDEREALGAALRIRVDHRTSDAELILRAYDKWGESCVSHLLGDFALAIWDRRSRHLFCARDHLGVRPLYYVSTHRWLLVSSSVASLRLHPDVSDTLDDRAVSDFLLFGHNAEPSATTFRDIRRVPPAHSLSWSAADACRIRRYWELPIEEPIYQRDEDCAAQFRLLLDTAIVDRARGQRVGVMFSGGLDSVTVAARARRHCAADGDYVRAFSFTRQSTPSDTDRHYAAAAAAHLHIPCDFYEADAAEGWAFPDRFTPEPLIQPVAPHTQARCLQDMAAHSRIAFTGEGPDNALIYEWSAYLRFLWRRGGLGRIACDVVSFLRHHRRLPLWSTIRRGGATSYAGGPPSIPAWMPADLVKRLALEDRWREVMRPADSQHPVRPAAWFSLQLPLWQTMHNEWDPCYTGVALELCHPFLDLRVLRFLLRVPVVPWCRDKHLLRYTFRADLPHSVRMRPKTPLPLPDEVARIRQVPPIVRCDRLEPYASLNAANSVTADAAGSAEGALRLATFSHWLARLESSNATAALD